MENLLRIKKVSHKFRFELFDLFTLFIGIVTVLVSWVMDEGRRLEEEQVHTV